MSINKKIVIKIGSSIIAPSGKLDVSLVDNLVKGILDAQDKGFKVVVVSSGAIACGLNKLGYKRRPQDTHSLMAISSLGQILLMDVYADSFKKHGKLCAQILLTRDDFDNRKRFINARRTIDKLLSMGLVPVINENDAVSFEEIKFGDNDCLSALVADMVGADKLFILSDVEGLLDGNKLVRKVECIDSKILSLVKKEDKTHTVGGMVTKLTAAKIAVSSGIETIIAHGRKVGKDLVKFLADEAGEDIKRTVFLPAKKINHARKRWIAFGKKVKGKIYIDDGAKEAVLTRGKSLLGVGIIKVEGEFESKDAVEILDKEGNILGRGIIDYSSELLKDLKIKKLEKEVIHRDNFVVEVCGE